MNLETFATDLKALTDDELEKVQLTVNGEVAVRIQDRRLARRIEVAVAEAQGVGYNDTDIASVIESATQKAREGRQDEAYVPARTNRETVQIVPAKLPAPTKETK